MTNRLVWVTGVLAGVDGTGGGAAGMEAGNAVGDEGPASCKFSLSISSIVFRSP